MKTSIDTQLVQIGLCWLMGFFAGFLYDAFRVLRRESDWKVLTAFLDIIFCAAVCFSLFIIGMSAGEGSLSATMLVFALIGFACYMLVLSRAVFKLFHRAFLCIKPLLSPIKKSFTAVSKTTKSVFSKGVYWLKEKLAPRKKDGEKANEKTENEDNSGRRNYGDPDLWSSQPAFGNSTAAQGGRS